jgi:hypothetical protein
LAYKKGRYMLDSRPGQLLGLPPGTQPTQAQKDQSKKVFDKVSLELPLERIGPYKVAKGLDASREDHGRYEIDSGKEVEGSKATFG